MDVRWCATVASLMYSLLAISLFRMPSHIRLMISFSRPVSDEILAFSAGSIGGFALHEGTEHTMAKAGQSRGRRWETFLTVLAIHSGAHCFNKIPFAPLRSAAS